MRLEKAQKNNAKEVENSKDSRTQQKRKNPEGASDGQNKKKKQTEGNKENEQKAKDNTDGQKKKKKQTEGNKEKEQKTKEREEKRKKKEQDQERQKLILEARKAQAAFRLATSSNSQQSLRSSYLHLNQFFGPIPLSQSDPLHKSLLLHS